MGGAPFAVTIILTVFMGGLGLGSYLAGRSIDRVKEPIKLVRIYGLLELAIAAYGLVLPLLLAALKPLYAILYNHLFAHFMPYNFLTFVGCAAILLFPVVCMGATLPILCRFYVTRLSHLGTHAGRLYGLNTIGAAFGALLGGFWLINLLGAWGGGFKVAMTALDRGRISVSSGAVGLAQACIDCSVTYANQRTQFAKPIAQFQLIKGSIAEMVSLTEAARLLVRRGAWLNDQDRSFTRDSLREVGGGDHGILD